MSSPISYDLQGQGGGVVLDDEANASGDFRWIQVIRDTVFNDLESSNIVNSGFIENATIPAGTGIGGRFSSVGVTSGLVIAYYA
jgi:hypothetical protein